MSFDAMAAAIDWLYAYRAGDLETILGMYAEDAVIVCGCGGTKTVAAAGKSSRLLGRSVDQISRVAARQPSAVRRRSAYLLCCA